MLQVNADEDRRKPEAEGAQAAREEQKRAIHGNEVSARCENQYL
jgi:hypothetical protein